jgi:hypothetical protein
MANGSFEEAKACPQCGLTGAESGSKNLEKGSGVTRGAKLILFMCMNSRCRWFRTTWAVQVNPDGTVPDPDEKRPKQFTAPVDAALVEQVRQNALAVQEASLHGGEIRNRKR